MQDISDQAFCQLELLKSGYEMQNIAKYRKDTLLDYIEEKLAEGIKLPLLTMKTLVKVLNQSQVLKIFALASKNEQMIPQRFLSEIIRKFYIDSDCSGKADLLYFEIFRNLVKNNQDLPFNLIHILENELQDNDLDEMILPIFVCLAQKGQKISRPVTEKMLDKLITETNLSQKKELLSALLSIMKAHENNIRVYELKIRTILDHELDSSNQNIQRLCVQIFTMLAKCFPQIDNELLEKLVHLGTSSHTHKILRNEILMLLEALPENSNINVLIKRQKMELANLPCVSEEEYLEQLKGFVSLKDGILPQNYSQLKNILDNGSLPLQQEALNLMRDLSCKDEFPDTLVDSIAILLENSHCNDLKKILPRNFEEVSGC